jgi:FlaA1/EpsC-like NDP-sugar epimerase
MNFSLDYKVLKKSFLLFFIDLLIIYFSLIISLYFRFDDFILTKNFLEKIKTYLYFIPFLLFFSYQFTGLKNILIRFFSFNNLKEVLFHSLLFTIFFFFIFSLEFRVVSKVLLTLIFFFLIFFTFVSRIIFFLIINYLKNKNKKIVIFGAGHTGQMLLNKFQYSDINILCFIDDSPFFDGKSIGGIKIYNRKKFENILNPNTVNEAWIAMSNPGSDVIKDLKSYFSSNLNIPVKFVSNIEEILVKRKSFGYQDLQLDFLDDFLKKNNDYNDFFNNKVYSFFKDKIILITGAGGSIGSEVCRQILSAKPNKIILLDVSESNLFKIFSEISTSKKKCEIIAIIGSTADDKRMNELFKNNNIDVCIHAAAYKHVGLVEKEENCTAAIINNVLGTYICAKYSINFNVKNFLLVSTDKAVNPSNIMGASKRICELIINYLASKNSNTKFLSVRFGNVIGSSGSVIPIFLDQIKKGGPITVTHEKMERFFMSISEAVSLVLYSTYYSKGGEIFVLDMGNPVNILDLAKRLIKHLNLTIKNEDNPDGQIEIVITKPQIGEKLTEDLFLKSQKLFLTDHKKIRFIKEENILDIVFLEKFLDDIKDLKVLKKNLIDDYLKKLLLINNF